MKIVLKAPKYYDEEFHPYGREDITGSFEQDGEQKTYSYLRSNAQEAIAEMADDELIKYGDLSAKAMETGSVEDKAAAFDFLHNSIATFWKSIEDLATKEKSGHVF